MNRNLSRLGFSGLWLAAVVLALPLFSAGQPPVGGAPAADAAPAPNDDNIYKLNPPAGDPAAIKRDLAAVDREIKRLTDRRDAMRAMPAREAAGERLKEINALREEAGGAFTKARWDALIGAIFAATESDRIAAVKFDDATLWNLSQNSAFLEAGQATVAFFCVPCHLPTLRGKGETGMAFAPDLTDAWWLHGGKPIEIREFVTHGAPEKGMPGWGALIGAKKVAEVVAYVLSKHQEGEPVYQQAKNVPIGTE